MVGSSLFYGATKDYPTIPQPQWKPWQQYALCKLMPCAAKMAEGKTYC